MEGYLAKAFLEYLRSNKAYEEEARKAGISLGFLTSVVEANIDDYVAEMIDWAADCGELYCPHCDDGEYYNANSVSRGEDGFLCPRCGKPLRSDWCARCGRHVGDTGDALVHQGWTYCKECFPG